MGKHGQRVVRFSSVASNQGEYVLLTPEQVAKIFQVSTETLRRWRDEGTGPRHVKLGNNIRYRKPDIDEYINENVRSSTHG